MFNKKLIISLIALAVCTTPALSATKTWDGGGSGTSWSSANNWNPNGVPGSSDNVIINAPGTTISVGWIGDTGGDQFENIDQRKDFFNLLLKTTHRYEQPRCLT